MKKKIVISHERSLGVFPGCLASIQDQYFALNTAPEEEIWGRLAIFTFNCAQCIENFLKYKIQGEGKKIDGIHNVLSLFKKLSDQEQACIRKSFAKLKTKHRVMPVDFASKEAEQTFRKFRNEIGTPEFYDPRKWNNVDDILEQIKDANINWRYIVEKGRSGLVHTSRLYLLVVSIYNTLDKP